MKLSGVLTLFIASSLLFSCATSRKSHEKLRKLVKAEKLDEAAKFVKSDKFFPEKENQLLKLLEMGMVQHLHGSYYQSLQSFDKAKDLSDKLYTVSISKKIKAAVSNDNQDNYYGEKYERSMIRFYQVLNHYSLYYNGEYEEFEVVQKDGEGKKIQKKTIPAKSLTSKERRFHLTAAKNVLLEWDSLLDNYKSTTKGKVTYKDDLLAKVFGAFIHEQMGTRHDNKVALNLYREAKKVLFRNFNILETYNGKSKKFKDDFKKLPKMGTKKVELNYVEKTSYYKELEEYLNQRIKYLKSGKKSNVFILVENGFITPKSFQKVDFPIPTTAIPTKVDVGGFMSFAGNVLSASGGTVPKIYFEIPEIPYRPVVGSPVLIIKKNGKVFKEEKFAVVNPLSNLASLTIGEDAVSRTAKIGTRVMTKHIAALVAAYVIYKQNLKTNEFLAMSLATVSYAGANKVIQLSEKADLRSWATLPHNYRLASLNLPKGEYEVSVKDPTGAKKNEKVLGKIVVDGKKTSLIKFRTY